MIAHIREDTNQEQPIIEHLQNVAEIAELLGAPLNMGNLAYITGMFHDLGKWRKKFEDYLREAVAHPERARRGEVNHSSAGAIYIYRRYFHGDELHRLTAQMIATAILSHHGLNDCLDPQGVDCFHKRIEQLDGLDYEEVIKNFHSSAIDESVLDELFLKAVSEVGQLIKLIQENRLSKSFTISMAERMLLSIIIDADRLDTVDFCGDADLNGSGGNSIAEYKAKRELYKTMPEVNMKLWQPLCDRLETRLAKFKKDDSISRLRRQVSDECLAFAEKETSIYRLAVPTGGAKTLSSLRYALNHAKEYKKQRIFYIAPYLSILEQNSQVFKTALGDGDYILEHHSNIVFDDVEGESKFQYYRYKRLTENWDCPIVITTFVQFLNTLFSDSTQSVRRFHNLADSVIIVDEIQSLPINMIFMFNLAMNYFSCINNTTVILCSATQPVLDKVTMPIYMGTPGDIIADKTSLYRQLKRVRIEEKKGLLDTGTLRGFVLEIMEEHDDVLLILNTKAAAKTIFDSLREYYQEAKEPVLLIHLSTSMCAEHRLNCINLLKQRLKKEKIICVSTSLIEAGVDLSFSCVIRSFAGMDSIAQAAGRCNRNGEAEEGIVYLIHYREEKLNRLDQTKKGAMCSENLVDEYSRFPERYDYDLLSPKALESFYQRYYYDPSQSRLMAYPVDKSGFILLDLLGMNRKGSMAARNAGVNPDLEMLQAFKTAGKNFNVISNNTVGVIVPYGEGAEIIGQLIGNSDVGHYKEYLRKAQRFTVNVFQHQFQRMNELEALKFLEDIGVWVLKDGFYNEQTGLTLDGRLEFLET